MEAIPLDDNSISLTWEPVADASAYQIYSDMGTGFGIYIFKAETRQPAFTDTNLHAGSCYQYRVGVVTPAGETVLASATVVTLGHSEPRARGRDSVVGTGDASAVAAPQPTRSPVQVTPAPTPLPPDTIILGLLSATDYADDVDGTLTIVGEVRNDSRLDVGQAVVTATFYEENGRVIGETSGSTMLRALAPGIRSPFVITLPRPKGMANYSLRATGLPAAAAPTDTELAVVNTRRFEDPAGFYHIAGVVENRGEWRVEQTRVVVTLYDRGGRVINVGFAYSQPSSLTPGARADFDVTFTYYPKVFSHLAIAMGD